MTNFDADVDSRGAVTTQAMELAAGLPDTAVAPLNGLLQSAKARILRLEWLCSFPGWDAKDWLRRAELATTAPRWLRHLPELLVAIAGCGVDHPDARAVGLRAARIALRISALDTAAGTASHAEALIKLAELSAVRGCPSFAVRRMLERALRLAAPLRQKHPQVPRSGLQSYFCLSRLDDQQWFYGGRRDEAERLRYAAAAWEVCLCLRGRFPLPWLRQLELTAWERLGKAMLDLNIPEAAPVLERANQIEEEYTATAKGAPALRSAAERAARRAAAEEEANGAEAAVRYLCRAAEFAMGAKAAHPKDAGALRFAANAQLALGEMEFKLDNFAAARRAAITSQQLMTEADLLSPPTSTDKIEWCVLHVLLGELCDADGDAPRACVEFERALGLLDEIESERGGGVWVISWRGRCLSAAARAWARAKEFAKALDYRKRCLVCAQEWNALERSAKTAHLLTELREQVADLYFELRDWEGAEQHLRAAVVAARLQAFRDPCYDPKERVARLAKRVGEVRRSARAARRGKPQSP